MTGVQTCALPISLPVDGDASAADLTRDKDSGAPGAIVSGMEDLITPEDGPGAGPLRRPADEDLFR